MSFLRRGPFERRSAAAIVFILFVSVGVVLIFTGALTRSTGVEAEAERLRSEVAVLQARVDAGNEEVEFLKSNTFVEQVARSIGLGEKGEIAFALDPDSPSPQPIVPLGSEASNASSQSPFDAWMELLFGG